MDKLTEVISSFGMHFTPSKCKVMLQVGAMRMDLTAVRGFEYLHNALSYTGVCLCGIRRVSHTRLLNGKRSDEHSLPSLQVGVWDEH